MPRQQNMPVLPDDELCPRNKRLTINYFLWSGMVYKPILPSTILNNRWVKISLWSSDKFTSYMSLCYKDYSYLCWYIYMAAVPWLKYCRHCVKLYPINQSINQYLYCHWEIKYLSVLLDSSTCLNTHQKDTDSAYSKLGRNQITH